MIGLGLGLSIGRGRTLERRVINAVRALGGWIVVPSAPTTELYVERTSPATVAHPGDPVGTVVETVSGLTFTAPSDIARAVLRREPAGGVRNALTFTEDFLNAEWTRENTTVSQVAGEVWELNEGISTGNHNIRQQVLSNTNPTGTAIDVRAGNASPWVRLTIRNNFVSPSIDFNLDTLEVIENLGSNLTNPVAGVTPLEDGWYRMFIRHNGASADTQNRHLALAILDSDRNLSHTGTGRTIQIRRPQREPGNVITPYQRVGNANDITEAGVRPLLCLRADGIDDGLQSTANFDPGATDKMVLIAGARKRSDASAGIVIEHGVITGGGLQTGSAYLAHSLAVGDETRRTWAAATRGSSTTVNGIAVKTIGLHPAPDLAVISALLDNAGASATERVTLRRNGVESTLGTSNIGSMGNFQPRRVNLLARDNASELTAAVDLYVAMCLPGALPAETLALLERYAALKSGVSLP